MGLNQASTSALIEITRRIFPGAVQITVESDPAWPDEEYVVVNVSSSGDVAKIVDRELDWHGRAIDLLPNCHNLRLAIDVVQ